MMRSEPVAHERDTTDKLVTVNIILFAASKVNVSQYGCRGDKSGHP